MRAKIKKEAQDLLRELGQVGDEERKTILASLKGMLLVAKMKHEERRKAEQKGA